jgi:hypothetical protein
MSGAVCVASARMRGGSLTLNRLKLDRSEAESCFGVGLICLLALVCCVVLFGFPLDIYPCLSVVLVVV